MSIAFATWFGVLLGFVGGVAVVSIGRAAAYGDGWLAGRRVGQAEQLDAMLDRGSPPDPIDVAEQAWREIDSPNPTGETP